MSKDIAVIPNKEEWELIKGQIDSYVKSQLLPSSVNTVEKAMLISMKGRELGIPPLTALSQIHVIQGRPTMSSELMLAQIYKCVPGAIINYLRTDSKACEIEAQRPGGKPSKFAYTIEEAQAAGLTNKDNWKKHTAAMLRARCISAVARAMFPDAVQGVSYTPEELGAEVDQSGNMIAASAAEAKTEKLKEDLKSEPIIKGPAPKSEAIEDAVIVEDSGQAFDPLGEYVIEFGKNFNGKKLKDCPKEGLKDFAEGFRRYAQEYGISLSGKTLEGLTRIDEYLQLNAQ